MALLPKEFRPFKTDPRADDYGGSSENYCRIVRRVIEAVRAGWQELLPVPISSTDYADGACISMTS